MGKGDKKSRKGKISMGSWGNSRKRKKDASVAAPMAATVADPAEEKPKKKAAAKK